MTEEIPRTALTKIGPSLVFLAAIATMLLAVPVNTVAAKVQETSTEEFEANVANEQKTSCISLTKIDDRFWLVGTDGNPFFAHGITHVGTKRAKFDFMELSNACKKIGFNAYGYGCPTELRSDMPYLESWNHLVPISLYRDQKSFQFIDIFDDQEKARLEKGVRVSCQKSKNNPNCIGYCWTDLAAWPLKNSRKTNWVEYIKNLPDNAPGKKAYQKFIDSWKGGEDSTRDQAFLRLIARKYFRVIGEANKKYDPDHLIFGDRFSLNTLDADVVKEMLPWVDAIAIQPPFWAPFPKKEFDEIHELTRKPILICDFAIRFQDGNKDVNSWKRAENSVEAGEQYAEYIQAAIESDYILGVFWCNPVDTTKGFGKSGVKQGFFRANLAERPGLHQAVKKLNQFRIEKTPKSIPK
ncbi:MAG: beta-agarase [Planctomycetota bacterium]